MRDSNPWRGGRGAFAPPALRPNQIDFPHSPRRLDEDIKLSRTLELEVIP
jgi:hypothetical protein